MIKARKKAWLPKECPACGKSKLEIRCGGSFVDLFPALLQATFMGYEPRRHHDRDPFKAYWWKPDKCGACLMKESLYEEDPLISRLAKISGDYSANISLPVHLRR